MRILGTLNTVSIIPYSTGVEMYLVEENLPINLPPTPTLSQSSSSSGEIIFNTSLSSTVSTRSTTGCVRIRRRAATTGRRVVSPGNRIPPSKWLLGVMIVIALFV